MGKANRIVVKERVEKEEKLKSLFISHNEKLKEVAQEPVKSVSDTYAWLFSPYKQYFIRDEDTFQLKAKSKSNKNTHILELSRHLFSKYPISQPFKNIWTSTQAEEKKDYNKNTSRYDITNKIKKPKMFFLSVANDAIAEIDFREWAICLATGGSLYKEYAKAFLTKKEVHVLTNCPHDLNILDAIVYSIAKANGADEGTSLKLAKSKMSDFINADVSFWKRVISFFIENHDCTLSKLNDFLDFIHAKRQNEAQLFNILNGATLKSLDIKMEEWHRELGRAKVLGNYSWAGMPLDNKSYVRRNLQDQESTWKFRQILNTKELGAEGTRMRHCVLSYKQKCIDGHCSIWSLEQEKNGISSPKITIEVSKDFTIVQTRGFANRQPKPEEAGIINEWAKDLGLTKSYRY